MNALRGLLIAALAVGLTLFASANWQPVTVNLGVALLDTWLPILVAAVLALVALPLWALGRARAMLLQRRLARLQAAYDASEAALAQARVELLRPPAAAIIAPPLSAPPAAPAAPPNESLA